ncbi:MAG TPA: type IV pilin protein [Burkholderiaceae bacterium]|nr:type IV pilin protein [Burkholderiaceae bacterium]
MKRRSRQLGFTLAEVMITVAIIGILAAIAYPNYTQYVIDSRRSRAQGCANEIAQFMERSYTTNQTYLTAGGAAPTITGFQCQTDLSGQYTIEPTAVAARTYTISATPIGGQGTKDGKCGCTLTLTNTGTKGVGTCFNGTKTAAVCWK